MAETLGGSFLFSVPSRLTEVCIRLQVTGSPPQHTLTCRAILAVRMNGEKFEDIHATDS